MRCVVCQCVKLPQKQTALDVVALQLHDLAVFSNGQLQHLLRRSAILHIAQGLQVDPPQQLVGVQVVRLGLENVLCSQHGVPNPAGAEIEFRQPTVQVFGAGIGVERQLVLLNRARRVLGAAIVGGHVLIHVRQAEMVVGRRAIRWFLRACGRCGCRLLPRTGCGARGRRCRRALRSLLPKGRSWGDDGGASKRYTKESCLARFRGGLRLDGHL